MIDIHEHGLYLVHVCMCVCVYRGDVVTMECVEKLIRKNEMLCPLSGNRLKDSDIIPIVRVSLIVTHAVPC